MKELRKRLALASLFLLSLSAVAVAQALPTTLVVKTSESKELCYDLGKISKITFEAGSIKLERSDAGKKFTPDAVAMSSIDKLFFANDRKENTTHLAPISLSPAATLSYYCVGEEIHIEGFTSSDKTLYLYTTDGQLLLQQPITSSTCILDASQWSQGLYLVTTNTRNTIKITIL